ncbi:MAG: hypothetical protein Q8K70_08555 [Bacteroidota bacterium]|nr:hypothetical protein [Bacteroidota bacterium]
MAKEIIRAYNSSDDYMCETSDTLHAIFVDELAAFTAYDSTLDATFASNWLAKIDDARTVVKDSQIKDILAQKILGSRTKKFTSVLARTNGYSELLIDSIKYEILGEYRYAEPMRFTTLNDQNDFVLKVKNQNSQFEIIPVTSENFERLNKNNNVLLYQIVNSDTFLLSEKKGYFESSYYSYTKYYQTKIPSIEFTCQKINDSTFRLKTFDSSGLLIIEGFSSRMEFDFLKTFISPYFIKTFIEINLQKDSFDFGSLLRLIEYNNYLAKDTWNYYNPQTQDVMIACFKPIVHKHSSNENDVIHFTCGNSIYCEPIGVWLIKDKNGKVLKSKKFN